MRRKLVLIVFIGGIVFALQTTSLIKNEPNIKRVNQILNNYNNKINRSDYWIVDPLLINGGATGAGAHNWTWAVSQPWCRGSGVSHDPFIIENLSIFINDYGNCIEIQNSQNVFIIKNCTLYNASIGIELKNVKNGNIVNNTCYNLKYQGILLRDSMYCNIENNTFHDNGYGPIYTIGDVFPWVGGVALWSSHNNTLHYNHFFANRDFGIALGDTITDYEGGRDHYPCYNNTVSQNIFEGTGCAIWTLPSSKDNIISHNKMIESSIFLEGSFRTRILRNSIINSILWFRGSVEATTSYYIDRTNEVNNRDVYYYANCTNLNKSSFIDPGEIILANCHNSLIENTKFLSCLSIEVYYCSNLIFKDNEINNSIFLERSHDCQIIGNDFVNNAGIQLWYSDSMVIASNSIRNTSSSYALTFAYSNGNLIHGNLFTNLQYGFWLVYVEYTTFSDNLIQLNEESYSHEKIGFDLSDECHNNSILRNTIINANTGIYLEFSNNNKIIQNVINLTDIGIQLLYSKFNSINSNTLFVSNHCFLISPLSTNNTFQNNCCNDICNLTFTPSRIPGFSPAIVALGLLMTSVIICFKKRIHQHFIHNT